MLSLFQPVGPDAVPQLALYKRLIVAMLISESCNKGNSMSNVMAELKAEISRLAAKAARAHTAVLKKTSARHRREIAALKREVVELRKNQTLLVKQVPKTLPTVPVEGDKLRFVAKGFRTMRKRLGLAAADLGKLIEVSGLTIYNWEAGKAKPRKMHLPKIAAIRAMGKREVVAMLEKAAPRKEATAPKAGKAATRTRKPSSKRSKKA